MKFRILISKLLSLELPWRFHGQMESSWTMHGTSRARILCQNIRLEPKRVLKNICDNRQNLFIFSCLTFRMVPKSCTNYFSSFWLAQPRSKSARFSAHPVISWNRAIFRLDIAIFKWHNIYILDIQVKRILNPALEFTLWNCLIFSMIRQ